MKKLRIQAFLDHIHAANDAAMSAEVKCACNCRSFRISHTGKKTKGILAPLVIRNNGQLVVKATCTSCGNSIVLYDSKTDGAGKEYRDAVLPFKELEIKGMDTNAWNIVVKYNYFPDKMKWKDGYSNEFENCFIEIAQNEKTQVLIEE